VNNLRDLYKYLRSRSLTLVLAYIQNHNFSKTINNQSFKPTLPQSITIFSSGRKFNNMLYATPSVILGLAALGSSHMIMNTPVPYGKSSLNNSPLEKDGSDFPCKQRSGVYDAQGASNSMPLGSSQALKFTGSATHGGGSCQISITYDKAPTKNSVFKVIHSIEGGCPVQGVEGNTGDNANAPSPSTYSFKVPTTLPTGDATLAWTWFNKVGNREMYMNCAPISITGSSTKRDDDYLEARNATQLVERDQAAFNALPDMFVANIGTGCGTQDSSDVKFPNPGDSVETLAGSTTSALKDPTGCAAGAGKPTGASGAGSGSGSGATTAAGSAVTPAPQASSAPASSPALSGGVFATVASSAGAGASSAPQASAPAAPSAPASQASSAATPASTGTTGGAGAMAAGTACTTEGMWNCIGGTSFQQCASGVWSAAQPVAGGTTCTPGQSTSYTIKAAGARRAKRAVRFSQEHVRRFDPENFNA